MCYTQGQFHPEKKKVKFAVTVSRCAFSCSLVSEDVECVRTDRSLRVSLEASLPWSLSTRQALPQAASPEHKMHCLALAREVVAKLLSKYDVCY